MKKVYLVLGGLVAGVTVALSACSSGSSGGGTTNEFSSLAEATGPVTTNGSLGSLFTSRKRESISQALTGVLLGSPGTFSPGTSLPFCENVNLLKEILRESAQPDKIMCYMGAMRAAGVIPLTVNITDGEVHYVRLINLPETGGGNGTPIVKFQIVKNGNAISSFKMWSCFNGTTNSPTQSEYMSQSFSGTTATLVSKNVGSEGTASYGSSMTATGDFESSWTSKNITGFRYYDDSGSANVMEINMDQYANIVQLSVAMNGLFGSDSYTNRFFTVAQLLGDRLSEYAIGDGSSKVNMSYDQGNDGVDHSDAATYSWNGDTKAPIAPATNGDYYATAHAGAVPAAPNATQTVSFSGAEAWDCSLPSGEEWVEADFTVGGATVEAGMTACEDKYLNGGSWVTCPY